MTLQLQSSDPDPIYLLRSDNGTVTCLQFVLWNGDEVLLSGHLNGKVCIWNLKSRRVISRIDCSTNNSILFLDVVHLNDNEYILSHDRGGFIHILSQDQDQTFHIMLTLQCHRFGFCPCHLTNYEGDTWIAYPSTSDSNIAVRKLSFDKNVQIINIKPTEKRGMVMTIHFIYCGDKQYIISGYEDGTIALWDTKICKIIDSQKLFDDPVMCLAVDSNKRKLICGSTNNSLQSLFINTEEMKFEHISKIQSNSTGFSSLSIRPDGKLFCVGCWDGKIRLLSLKKTMKPLAILKYHEQTINAIAFNSQKYIAAACKDGRISFWDVYSAS